MHKQNRRLSRRARESTLARSRFYVFTAAILAGAAIAPDERANAVLKSPAEQVDCNRFASPDCGGVCTLPVTKGCYVVVHGGWTPVLDRYEHRVQTGPADLVAR